MAKQYIEGYDHRNLILDIIKPWIVFGGTGIYVDMRYHYSVSALEETTACYIDTGNLKRLVRENPNFAEQFMNHLFLSLQCQSHRSPVQGDDF